MRSAAISILSYCCSVIQSCLTLRPHGLQHARISCPSLSPRVRSNSFPLSQRQWSNHLIPCFHLLLTSVFPGIRLFSNELSLGSRCQSIGASASVLPMNIQGWFPLGLTGFISLLSKGLSRVSSNTTIWKHQFFSAQSSLVQFSHLYVTTGETTALTIQTIVSKVTISLSIFVTFCILNAQEVTDMSKKYSICWMNKWVNKLQSFH